VVFLPGTGDKPTNITDLYDVAAKQGYRVLALDYDDNPAVQQTCPGAAAPSACSYQFREDRIFGDAASPPTGTSTPYHETIVARLVAALVYLDGQHPGDGWSRYLSGGQPNWSNIVVSGLSQGAGMAAFIAKKELVARVVLFSSPWDYDGYVNQPANWLSNPSATPRELWYAEYNENENFRSQLQAAYTALQIPGRNLWDFRLPHLSSESGDNPYHGDTVHNTDYIDEWRKMFGTSL